MMENTIGWVSILQAGLWHGINPASFLGCFLLLALVIRIEKIYGIGNVFGVCVVFFFFIAQFFIHLGIADYFYINVPHFILLWDALRIFVAVVFLIFGWYLFWRIYICKENGGQALKGALYCFSPKNLRRSFWQRALVLAASFFWGMIFAFFCGLWPLENKVLYVVYQMMFNLSPKLFWRIVTYEAVAMLPYFIMLFMLAVIFHRKELRKRIINSRIIMIGFSALSIAAAGGMLAYYVIFFS